MSITSDDLKVARASARIPSYEALVTDYEASEFRVFFRDGVALEQLRLLLLTVLLDGASYFFHRCLVIGPIKAHEELKAFHAELRIKANAIKAAAQRESGGG